MSFRKNFGKTVKKYIRHLKFYCPYCGRKTKISEFKKPLGKKKLCKGCGQIFDLVEENMQPPWATATSIGDNRQETKKDEEGIVAGEKASHPKDEKSSSRGVQTALTRLVSGNRILAVLVATVVIVGILLVLGFVGFL